MSSARCWNGPLRSVNVSITVLDSLPYPRAASTDPQVELSCGTANALLSVSEPEKCEYKFKVTSPALCYPLEVANLTGADGKDEL
jgi:protein kinase C substrate 80K-H